MTMRVETTGSFEPFVVNLNMNCNYYLTDDQCGNPASVVVENGSLIHWVSESGGQDVSWGNYMYIGVDAAQIPEGLETIQIFLNEVEADTENIVFSNESTDWLETPFVGGMPWNLFEVIDPNSLLSVVYNANWSALTDPYRAVKYIDPLNVCVLERNDLCHLMRMFSYVEANNVSLSAFRVSFETVNMDAFSVYVDVHYDNSQYDDVRRFLFEVSSGISTFTLPEDVLLLNSVGSSAIDISVQTVNTADLRRSADAGVWETSELTITVEELAVSRQDETVNVSFYGPQAPGIGPYFSQTFPFTGATLVFHAEEIWLEANYSNGPIRTVSVATQGEEKVELFKADFLNLYGAVAPERLTFLHNSGKVSPPFGDITLRINQNVYVLVDWNAEHAVFEITANYNSRIIENSMFTVMVEGYQPTDPTEFMQFSLSEMLVVPFEFEQPNVPVIIDEDSLCNQTVLNVDNQISGRRWRIVP